jgi:predicted GNAT family acetyltransferase
MAEDRDLRLSDNAARQRYELRRGETVVGVADYRTAPGVVILDHVEVDPAFRGQGVGSRLVADVLDDIRERGLSVVAICPFVSWYLDRHSEYGDLVAREATAG